MVKTHLISVRVRNLCDQHPADMLCNQKSYNIYGSFYQLVLSPIDQKYVFGGYVLNSYQAPTSAYHTRRSYQTKDARPASCTDTRENTIRPSIKCSFSNGFIFSFARDAFNPLSIVLLQNAHNMLTRSIGSNEVKRLELNVSIMQSLVRREDMHVQPYSLPCVMRLAAAKVDIEYFVSVGHNADTSLAQQNTYNPFRQRQPHGPLA